MHLVWDWNGTLLNDFDAVVRCTNLAFASVNGRAVSPDEHRRQFRRPIAEYYAEVLDRPVDAEEFARLDKLFHDEYRTRLSECALAHDARAAIRAWGGEQSLLSMWFHTDLVPTVDGYGLTELFRRVDGLRTGAEPGGNGHGGTGRGSADHKAGHLAAHLAALGVPGADAVLIGDSLDDADAAAAVGARAVLYTGGFTDADRLRGYGVPVADTLLEAVALAQPRR
ncbi:HAD family hydrolase [Rhizomonospora bruguierae]|uniref:HAD family hydrolase n=1 Tax=Rhizomonospora bruguierae TaxID=1581705 RepID=UPI001BD14E88|nr:HAD hydrolase-like protein [Micromonospora sp. NBRC 107566]